MQLNTFIPEKYLLTKCHRSIFLFNRLISDTGHVFALSETCVSDVHDRHILRAYRRIYSALYMQVARQYRRAAMPSSAERHGPLGAPMSAKLFALTRARATPAHNTHNGHPDVCGGMRSPDYNQSVTFRTTRQCRETRLLTLCVSTFGLFSSGTLANTHTQAHTDMYRIHTKMWILMRIYLIFPPRARALNFYDLNG